MRGSHICFFAGVGLQVEKLPVLFDFGSADEMPAFVAYAALRVFEFLRVGAFGPATNVR